MIRVRTATAAWAIAWHPDGNRFFAGLSGAGAVVAFDTRSLENPIATLKDAALGINISSLIFVEQNDVCPITALIGASATNLFCIMDEKVYPGEKGTDCSCFS